MKTQKFISSFLISILFLLNIAAHANELTLEQAMNKAETTSQLSKAIAIANQNIEINKENKNAQILSMLPNISIQGQYLKPAKWANPLTTTPISPDVSITTSGLTTTFTGGINLTQPIIGLYSLVLQLGQNSALLRASIQNKNQTVQDARYNGAASFINCEKAYQLIKVADAAIDVAQKQLSDAEARFNEGLLTNADVLKFKLDLDNAKTIRVHAETSYQVTLATLADIIGEQNSQSIVLSKDYKSVMEAKRDTLGHLDDTIQKRLPLRYDILSLQENVTATSYAKQNAIATYLPTFDFIIVYGHDFNAKPIFDNEGNLRFKASEIDNSLSYGASLTWNFIDWGVRQTQINAASATEQIARLQLIESKDNAKVDITATYNKLLDAYESLNLTKNSVNYAETVYKQRYEQFQGGLISSTDLVIAANDQTNARANYVNAVGDLDLAWMAYYRSTRQRLTTLN